MISSYTYESRACYLCHRVGYRGFVPYEDAAWRCLRDDVCARRRERQARNGYADLAAAQTDEDTWISRAASRRKTRLID